jgi:RNA polymerase sigma-70 factor (ECF subfamily)
MAISLRYIHDREDVKDVMQECFIKIFNSINGFNYRGEGSLKGWVSTVVVNQTIDWVTAHEKMHLVIERPLEMPEPIDEEPPDIEKVPPEVLNRMIGRLPAGFRLVLNLHVFERLSHKEIAQRLGIKEMSSASQFSRAKTLLKKMIDDYLNSEGI